MGRAARLASWLPNLLRLAWWGWVTPLAERESLTVHQAVVLGDEGVLLAVRHDLRGWELPGGSALPGETSEQAVVREVAEETGLSIAVEAHVGDYHRSGFRPHTARVHRGRVVGGALRPSDETPAVAWFSPNDLPSTLFPWYRGPLADALAGRTTPALVHEHQGWRHIAAGLWIDAVQRWRGPEDPTPPSLGSGARGSD